MMDYKKEINSIYNKSKETSISDNRLVKIFELFYKYCILYNIEKAKTGEEGQYLYVLVDSINKADKYYAQSKEECVDFFSYALVIIKNDIKMEQLKESEKKASVISVPESTKREFRKNIKLVKDIANDKCIDICRISDKDIEILSKETGFGIDKIKSLLEIETSKKTKSLFIKKEKDDGEKESIENPRIKHTEDVYEGDSLSEQQIFSKINNVYSSLSLKQQNKYKIVLTNFFIKNLTRENTDIDNELELILSQFKFYDKTNDTILQIVNYFFENKKCKTQEEIAKIIGVTPTYVSKMENDFCDILKANGINLKD